MRKAFEERTKSWSRACALSEILPNTGVCCLVGREQVAVFRVGAGERVYAIGNHDPFSKANVLARGIVGDRAGRPKVASPIYKQSFCLETGQCLDDANVRVPAYSVRIQGGFVEISKLATSPLPVGNTGLISRAQ